MKKHLRHIPSQFHNRLNYITQYGNQVHLYRYKSRAGEPVGAGGGASWKKTQEPEPLGKKLGARAAKKLAGSSALQEDKGHKEIVL